MNQNMNNDEKFLEEILGERPVAYRPIIAKALGSINAGLFVSQLYYWKDKGSSGDGWIYKTRSDLFNELGLTRQKQESARKRAMEMGITSEMIRGIPPKVHFKIDISALARVIREYLEENPETNRRKTSQSVCQTIENAPIERSKGLYTRGGVTTKKQEGYRPNFYTKSTSQSTRENKAESTPLSFIESKYAKFNK